MQLPSELVTALSVILVGFVTTLIVDGFKSLSETLNIDLSKVGTIIAAAASAFVVSVVIGLINFSLGFVPPEWYPIVQAFFVVIIGSLGAMGLHRRSKLNRTVG